MVGGLLVLEVKLQTMPCRPPRLLMAEARHVLATKAADGRGKACAAAKYWMAGTRQGTGRQMNGSFIKAPVLTEPAMVPSGEGPIWGP